MSKLEDLADKILKSESHRSFATESWVRETISGLRWTAVQGAIYQDPREGKLREIDVLARRSWESSTAKKARVDVVLVIECKTMKGFHLLLAPASVGYLRFRTSQLASWLGYVYQEERPEITAALEKYGYGRGEVAEILKRIGKACYPRQYAKVGKFFIEPPPIATLFNAWKETNIGAEKDLDTSVFWRAVLALDSCVTSLRARRVQAFLEELEATVAAPGNDSGKKAGFPRFRLQALL
jgi:hypothetical protein